MWKASNDQRAPLVLVRLHCSFPVQSETLWGGKYERAFHIQKNQNLNKLPLFPSLMPSCEMCGKETEDLFKARIEGTEMAVCRPCTKYGKVFASLKKTDEKAKKFSIEPPKEEKSEETIVENFSQLIRKARENSQLTQEDFAKKINEKLSVLQKMEAGLFLPGIDNAKKLEKMLGLKLVAFSENKAVPQEKAKSGELTLGDVIKIRKRN